MAWKNLDVVIFNSELSLSRAEESGLLKEKEKYVIYPPIDFSRFERLKNEKGNSFVYISRLNNPKRQDVLLEAWNIFSKENKGYKLILIGTPDNKKYYETLKELSEGDKSIEIKSGVSNKELEYILRKSLAGFFLGYQEDFGIVPLEILGAGKPLLAVDEGGYVKVIDKHPLFHRIKEKHSRGEMVKEISKELENFVKKSKFKGNVEKIKMKNFIEEIDEVLGK